MVALKLQSTCVIITSPSSSVHGFESGVKNCGAKAKMSHEVFPLQKGSRFGDLQSLLPTLNLPHVPRGFPYEAKVILSMTLPGGHCTVPRSRLDKTRHATFGSVVAVLVLVLVIVVDDVVVVVDVVVHATRWS